MSMNSINIICFALPVALFALPFVRAPYLISLVLAVFKVNAGLAFFNMLPIPPLDGSKVVTWNPVAWLLVIGFAFLLSFVVPI